MLNKFISVMDNILKYVLAALLIGMVAIIFLQILTRYVFQSPLSWSEEVARYLFIFVTYLGVSRAIGTGGHIAMDILTSNLKPRAHSLVNLIIDLIVAFYFAFLIYTSMLLLPIIARQFTPALNISYVFIYIAIPLGSLISIIYLLDKTIGDVKNLLQKGGNEI
jgi:TRAP-type C4-dicarboxylate transport system permease small subunit